MTDSKEGQIPFNLILKIVLFEKGFFDMKKILFFPLLRMQSGHHQVADALMDMVRGRNEEYEIKKIDLISYWHPGLEKMLSRSYLNWIRLFPNSYNFIYSKRYCTANQPKKFYENHFLKKMEQLIELEKPDAIVCTHGFPSCLISRLKVQGKCEVPVINAYTDFFINGIWAKEGIDLHFVPSKEVKEHLIREFGIPRKHIIVTGIPVHEEIKKGTSRNKRNDRAHILVAGGNSGLGGISSLTTELKKHPEFQFYILCGNNKKLYDEIHGWKESHIKPLSYISSRTEMDKLYDKMDAIITKPGGVTISEALRKKLPIIVHSHLPGQEKINLDYLKKHNLVVELSKEMPIESQLNAILNDSQILGACAHSIECYEDEIELELTSQLHEVFKWLLGNGRKLQPAFEYSPTLQWEMVRG